MQSNMSLPDRHLRQRRIIEAVGLLLRTKLPRRRRAWRTREGRAGAEAANEVWAMDLLSDQLFDGRPVRVLTVVDIHTREGLSATPGASFRAAQVVEVLDQLVQHAAGVWARLHRVLLERLHDAGQLDWSRAALDSASLAAKKGVRRSGPTRRTVAGRAPSATSPRTPAARRSASR